MPLFFFHYSTPDSVSQDDIGCHFETLEDAYVDAYRSAIDLGAQMLKDHQNPASHRIDIANTDGLVLTEIRFDEIFGRSRAPLRSYDQSAKVFRERLSKFNQLRDEVYKMCLVARENVAKTQETLRRAKASSS